MPGTLALVVEHAHRRACALQAAAGEVHTGVPVRHSRRQIRWADSCSTVEHCRYHAVALDGLPPAQRWPRRARSAPEQNRMEGNEMGNERHSDTMRVAREWRRNLPHNWAALCLVFVGIALDRDRCGIYPLTMCDTRRCVLRPG